MSSSIINRDADMLDKSQIIFKVATRIRSVLLPSDRRLTLEFTALERRVSFAQTDNFAMQSLKKKTKQKRKTPA